MDYKNFTITSFDYSGNILFNFDNYDGSIFVINSDNINVIGNAVDIFNKIIKNFKNEGSPIMIMGNKLKSTKALNNTFDEKLNTKDLNKVNLLIQNVDFSSKDDLEKCFETLLSAIKDK